MNSEKPVKKGGDTFNTLSSSDWKKSIAEGRKLQSRQKEISRLLKIGALSAIQAMNKKPVTEELDMGQAPALPAIKPKPKIPKWGHQSQGQTEIGF